MLKTYLSTMIGMLEITEENSKIISVGLCKEVGKSECSESLDNCIRQINDYFSKATSAFNIEYDLRGTSFQKEVWNELINIPYGATCTYLDIAIKINRPNSVRAVANAIGKNPIAIIIPCHRVIGKNGSLTGYAYGIDRKMILLELEKK